MKRALLIAALALAFPAHARAAVIYSTNHGLFVANDDGGGKRRIADDGSQLAFSPDGRYVAFQGPENREHFIAPADGSAAPRKLPANIQFLDDSSGWTASDELIAQRLHTVGHKKCGCPIHTRTVVAIDPVTLAQRDLGAPGPYPYSASVSPDGTQVALERTDSSAIEEPIGRDISILGPTGLHPLVRGQRPLWGPGGIAYIKPTKPQRFGDLQIVTPAGATVYTLHRPKAVTWPIAWLADGRLLAGTSRSYGLGEGQAGVRALLIDPATGAVAQLPGAYSQVYGMTPDGSRLFASTDVANMPVTIATGTGVMNLLFDDDIEDIAFSAT
jgi:hypothetical protein